MAREASDATLLKRERANNRRLTTELFESQQVATREIQRAKALAKEVDEWKARFDALLKRDAALSQGGGA